MRNGIYPSCLVGLESRTIQEDLGCLAYREDLKEERKEKFKGNNNNIEFLYRALQVTNVTYQSAHNIITRSLDS